MLKSAFMIALSFTGLTYAMESDSQADANVPYTPRTDAAIHQLPLTPEEMIVAMQRDVLTRDEFVRVVGEDLTADFETQCGIDWSMFADTSIAFDHPNRRDGIRKTRNFLKAVSRELKCDELIIYYSKILFIDDDYKMLHLDHLEECARNYFSRIYPDAAVTFGYKPGGDQLGTKLYLKSPDGKQTAWFVKTHSSGMKSEHSSAVKRVDPREPAVYKLLEYFGVGCETRLFGRDLMDFYIAVKDAGADGKFITYEALKRKHAVEFAKIRELRDFIEGLTVLDVLSRILRLNDLLTNSDNFGFVITDNVYCVKAIDLRVQGGGDMKLNREHFGGFLEGNGTHIFTENNMWKILRKRPVEDRVADAKAMFVQHLEHYEEVITRAQNACREAITAVAATAGGVEDGEAVSDQLGEYMDIIRENFRFFEHRLNSYVPDER